MDTMSLALEIAKQNDLKWNSVKVLSLLPFDILDDRIAVFIFAMKTLFIFFLNLLN